MILNLDGLDGNTPKKTVKRTTAKRPIAKKKRKATAYKKPVLAATAAAVTGAVVLAPAVLPPVAQKPVVTSTTLNPNPFKKAEESALDKLLGTVQQAVPVVIAGVAAARNQKRIDKLQDQAIKATGKPYSPDEIDRLMDASAPVIKIKGGVDTNTNKTLMFGGLAVAGLLVFMATKKKGNSRG